MEIENKIIKEFGEEWTKYDYSSIDKKELFKNFKQYFDIFPWDLISSESKGFDMGCGSGRWAQFVAPKVKTLFCIEPSKAIQIAKKNLKEFSNVQYLNETTDTCSLDDASQDFGYCLGVLHHIPDTQSALNDCSRLLKRNAPFLLYLYYNFENKPWLFKAIWRVSELARKVISSLPQKPKRFVCNIIAITVYFPLSRLSLLVEKIGIDVSNIPLSDYRNKLFYQSQNDALDRFGTRLEQRFSMLQIIEMMENAGFDNITISDGTPYWHAIAYKT